MSDSTPAAVPDFTPAAQLLAALVRDVPDELLSAPTPCTEYAVADLLDHIGGFAIGFTAAARKSFGEGTDSAPNPDGSKLGPDWRERIPQTVLGLADAWKDPAAWTGMTRAGVVELPGDAAGMFALDELVIHGWDLARATGRDFDVDEPSLLALHGMLSELMAAGPPVPGLFGPPVDVDADAPLLVRVLGLTGRHFPG